MRFISLLIVSLLVVACQPGKHFPAKLEEQPKPRPKPVKQGEPLSPFTFLRKVSLHIRGQVPTREEYDELTKAIEKNQQKEFLQRKIDRYLASNEHIDKMTFRLEELFALKVSGVSAFGPLKNMGANNTRGQQPFFHDFPLHNSMNEMFRETISRNLSWDNLLTGKKYKVLPIKDQRDTFYQSDARFFSAQEGDLEFSESDHRVSGVLTTSRFYGRFVNTALNKNRKRAAAIFRVALCDDMKAVVVDEKGNQNEVLDKVFPAQAGNSTPVDRTKDRHGSDPACLKCHYKLDPMGLTFQGAGMVLAPLASPGALVYTDSRGQKVSQAAAGVGELGQLVTQQDDYVRCQVKHFWRWFVGEDKPLNEALLGELSTKFNEVRRKPNDFIAYLVNRPEFGFAEESGANGPLVAEVKNILQNCNGCHSLEGIPSFSDWPIGGEAKWHQKYLSGIRRSLSLDGSTRPRSMPPKESRWQPTPAQLTTLQQWYDLGAPNE